MTVTCNYRSTAVIILPGVYLPPQRNATVADDAFSLLFISIHAPREGSDVLGVQVRCYHDLFQSTLPARGATYASGVRRGVVESFQSTLPARGATVGDTITIRKPAISIHAPREGSDICGRQRQAYCVDFNPRSPRGERLAKYQTASKPPKFQSTLPARGATNYPVGWLRRVAISIHAPREGSDSRYCTSCITAKLFQSTLPARGATTWRGNRSHTTN